MNFASWSSRTTYGPKPGILGRLHVRLTETGKMKPMHSYATMPLTFVVFESATVIRALNPAAEFVTYTILSPKFPESAATAAVWPCKSTFSSVSNS